MASITVVIPAYNEENAIADTVRAVRQAFAPTPHELEIIVVDDCSSDRTRQFAEETGACVISHPRNAGYGNAISTGVRNARHPWIGITDADGTYPVEELPSMLEEAAERDLDMLVGARQGKHYRGNAIKAWVRVAFKLLSEFTVGQKIPDINSGLRVMRRDMLMRFAPVMSGGFSYTTTITIIAFLTYHFVDYRPIAYHPRIDASHVRYVRDTLRAAQIIIMTILFFNPIKLYILQCLAALVAGCAIATLALVFPQAGYALLVLAIAVGTANIVAGLGFLAEQRRIQHTGIVLPDRGYVPRDRRDH